ncbi:LTA synthase family protein [Pararcticibacter amylolyticus]|uniref:Sulfatase N-terminal domain-containing protein n=1 Tax=Pararcticibacter amylolyticus TaxID=2173175 RepID=A0A2U2PDW0_9SPHI|nr:alkaline phosphatase family protein [Pararcticibacter amylolyticus]PWG79502.1 hypothetical protein DDR33_17260 [Pararcticibacter amylolyticus]
MHDRFNQFYNSIYKLFQIYIFQLLIFTCFRISFIIRLHNTDILRLPADAAMAFLRGFQYDTMVISYTLVLPFALCLPILFTPGGRYRTFIEKVIWGFFGLSTAIFLLILFIDQYFYNYFQSHINILIFGLIDDDTKAVMSSVWSDYPIWKIFTMWLSVMTAYVFFIRRINKKKELNMKLPVWTSTIASLALVAILFLGIRQSLGIFPLQPHDAAVSSCKSINFLPINGVYALKTSFSEREKSENLNTSAKAILKQLGYEHAAQAARDYFTGKEVPQHLSDEEALKLLFHTTRKNAFLKKNRPNVVFVMMESMSNYNMSFDSDSTDLLAGLRTHFKSDLVFRNFVSGGTTTIQSLEFLLVNTPICLTQSKYRFQPFPTGVAYPFKNSGYETSFLTGGETTWRNIHEMAPQQGFEKLYGKYDIYNSIKNSEGNNWGAYDEYLFDFAYKKLSDGGTEPKFMFIQTTTNHTPFILPSSYKPGEIKLTSAVRKRLLVKEDLAVKNLTSLQYGNNCLGAFLNRIKNSPLAENTIVVATGDHNNLMLFDFDESQQLAQRSVPLYMYIPRRYRPAQTDTEIYGSHKDIFPTIYNLALSGSTYYSVGNDLFNLSDKSVFFGTNFSSCTAFSPDAAANFNNSPILYESRSKNLIRNDKYHNAQTLLRRARAQYALSLFAIMSSLSPEHSPSGNQRAKLPPSNSQL